MTCLPSWAYDVTHIQHAHTHTQITQFTHVTCQVGALAAALPQLGLAFDASFLEEPVMLLAFVMLGRALEARAKVRGPCYELVYRVSVGMCHAICYNRRAKVPGGALGMANPR